MTRLLDLRLPGGPRAASAARGALDRLRGEMDAETFDNLRLLVSELVTNSIRHSGLGRGDEIVLEVSLSGNGVRVEVCDPGPGFPARARVPTLGQTSGWGLFLVEQIAERWGVRANERTCVWFELTRSRSR
ncbi:MAG: ATP-binding protein [Actinobacteria bacterium]|nr:ATP-binding protein [Actinomycetota bacterium]